MHYVYDYRLCHAKTEKFIYQLINLVLLNIKHGESGEGIKYEETFHLFSDHFN